MADKLGRSDELHQSMVEWHKRITDNQARFSEMRGGSGLALEEVQRMRVHYKATSTLAEYVDPPSVEGMLVKWASMLSGMDGANVDIDKWYDEVRLYEREVLSALGPAFDGSRCSQAIKALEVPAVAVQSDDVSVRKKAQAFKNSCAKVDSIVQQHIRYRALKGVAVFETVTASKESVHAKGTLIYVFNPAALASPEALQRLCENDALSKSEAALRVMYVAVQCGFAWDETKQRFIQSAAQTSEEEAKALSLLGQQLGLSGEVSLMARDSADARRLAVTHAPLSILLDPKGKVRCILIGSEREQVARLLKLANDVQ